MQLLHVIENQIDGLWFISALLDSVGIAHGLGETLGHGLIRVTLDEDKPHHIVKDHTKFDIRAKDASDFMDYRRLATEALAQLGYRFHSIGFQPPPRENKDPHASVMTIAGIQREQRLLRKLEDMLASKSMAVS